MADSSNLRDWSASDVGVREHGRWLFRHVSAEAALGELVSIVADPGAARGTLALTLAGRLRPTEGDVRFGGEPLGAGRVSHRSAIGWLAGMRLYEDRARCREVVGQAYRLSRTPKAQRDVDGLLRTAGLTDPDAVAADLREIDKAALGTAVLRALRPEIAFVDVPAASPAGRDGIAASIQSLREQGSTVVVLHHEAWPGATKTVLVGYEAQGDPGAVAGDDAETRADDDGADATEARRADDEDAAAHGDAEPRTDDGPGTDATSPRTEDSDDSSAARSSAEAPSAQPPGTDGETAPAPSTHASTDSAAPAPQNEGAPAAEEPDAAADEAPEHPSLTRRQRHGRA